MNHVYFGGTFDPPHLGHDKMLRVLLEDSWVAKVHLVPTASNPLKNSTGDAAPLGSLAHRKAWVEGWVVELQKQLPQSAFEKLNVEWLEFNGPKISYTIDTLSQLRSAEQRNGDTRPWVLCVGSDVLPLLHKWKQVRELLSTLHSVWVFSRGQTVELEKVLSKELLDLAEFRVMEPVIDPISSTQIRQSLRKSSERGESPSAELPVVKGWKF